MPDRPRSERTPEAELKVIEDFYAFMLWLIQHIERFPRHHRYSLGIAVENRLQVIIGALIEAKYARVKDAILSRANIELELLRFQLRLAKDLKAMPIRSHGSASQSLAAIGAQVGGWRKAQGGRQ